MGWVWFRTPFLLYVCSSMALAFNALVLLPLAFGLDVTTFHWNIHRPCGISGGSCEAAANGAMSSMVGEVGAHLVGAVELGNAGIGGFASSGIQCDHISVLAGGGWHIVKSGGACMEGNVKGLAVALMTPPSAVRGCPEICVFAVHVPHDGGGLARNAISSVCGNAAQHCAIGMGDWNNPNIYGIWSGLVGGSPVLVHPNEKTCCYNNFAFAYDHTATNIAGATGYTKKIWGPQLTRFPSYDEHKPCSVSLRLPSLSDEDGDLVPSSNTTILL